MNISVTSEFEKWAKGFSGCDGGNLETGKIWFSGIEWGLGFDSTAFNFDKYPSEKIEEWLDDYRDTFRKSPFDRGVVQLYSVMTGNKVGDYLKVAKEEKVFARDSKLFKMNIYPLAFKRDGDELWNEGWYKITGLPTKSTYRAWCQQHRFPEIKKWVEKYNPKVVIASGVSYKADFLMAFAGPEQLYTLSKIVPESIAEGREFFWCEINNGKTILVIIPFLTGRWGLNSYDLIEKFGSRISEICTNKFGEKWL
ncbi:MAG: hypothetical protein ACOY3O_00335 [Thermodesulfobacteriota bacterium]